MATSAEYNLGPHTYPRGWFIVAETCELDNGPLAIHFFGKDFALYRGESGRIVMLDAYCSHMGAHLAASTSPVIVQENRQMEGDGIRCPYHGWLYNADGEVADIPGMDPCPKVKGVKSYAVRDVMGCVMAWHDPEGAPPAFDPPYLKEWDNPRWIHWKLDHLGKLNVHQQEILDNMADTAHFPPTHGMGCEVFENEFRDHIYIQRQGGFHDTYNARLATVTFYTGPGMLLSKQEFGGVLTFEMIANTPVDDGVSQVWHGCLTLAESETVTDADVERARQVQAHALEVFGTDFEVWKHKAPALRAMQMPVDGPFVKGRKWLSQFYAQSNDVAGIQRSLNGKYYSEAMPGEAGEDIMKLEVDLFD